MTPQRAAGFSAELFGYDYCPVVRKLRARQNEKWISFGFSFAAHCCILILAGITFIKPVEFGVDQGLSGMEVQLVAGSEEAIAATVPEEIVEPVQPDPESIIEPEEVKQPEPEEVKTETPGNAPINAFSTGQGAITEARPDYLKNPAPRYPFEARRKGWEGTVVLKALVDKNGNPLSVAVEQSSGHSVLDKAAAKTVKTWQFRPAEIGGVKIESSVQVPVRFDLKDAERI